MKIKSNCIVTLKVAPEYRNMLKMAASRQGKSILEYSRQVSKDFLNDEGKKYNGFKLNF